MIPLFKTNMIISISTFILLLIITIIYKNNNKRYPISDYYYSLEFMGVIINKYEQPKLHNCYIISIMQEDNVVFEFDFPLTGNDIYQNCNIGDSIHKSANSKSIVIIHNGVARSLFLNFINSEY